MGKSQKKRGLIKRGLVCLGKQKMPNTEEIQTLSSCWSIILGSHLCLCAECLGRILMTGKCVVNMWSTLKQREKEDPPCVCISKEREQGKIFSDATLFEEAPLMARQWKPSSFHGGGPCSVQKVNKYYKPACLPFTGSTFETNVTILVTEQKWKLSVLI